MSEKSVPQLIEPNQIIKYCCIFKSSTPKKNKNIQLKLIFFFLSNFKIYYDILIIIELLI